MDDSDNKTDIDRGYLLQHYRYVHPHYGAQVDTKNASAPPKEPLYKNGLITGEFSSIALKNISVSINRQIIYYHCKPFF